MATRSSITIGNRRLSVSNLDKVLWPATGFTKGDVIDYYRRIADVVLPHLRDRPVTLKRYPNGVDQKFFYEKECPDHRPDWVKTVPMRRSDGKDVNYCLINSESALAWTANLANLELHVSLATRRDVYRPTSLVFDLDPGPGTGILDCGEVACRLEELFGRLGLESFVKTSGSKGMQLYVPLNTKVTYDDTKPFAHAVALRLEEEHPAQITSNMSKAERAGKVFIDWSQNDDHKTTVAVYSLRAKDRPTVSTALSWRELRTALRRDDDEALVFEAADVVRRVAKKGDLFEPVAKLKQKLPQLTAGGSAARVP